MTADFPHTILRSSNGKRYRFVFKDGEEMFAEVISDTHVDEDDTIIILGVGATPGECGWQCRLSDILSILAENGSCLFQAR